MTPPNTDTPTPCDAPGEIRTVSLVSLGCPKNLVDSEKMLGLLAEAGLVPVSADAGVDSEHDDLSASGSEQDASAAGGRVTPADAVVINTCGFLEASKDESLGVIRDAIEAKNRGEVKRVVVAGCLVQRHRAKILEWAPGIDALVGVFDREHIVEAVSGSAVERTDVEADKPPFWIHANALTSAKAHGLKSVGLTVQGQDGKGIGYYEDDSARLRLTPRHYAYLRVSEGCNQKCAFCTIPSIRGKMRSKPIDRIVAETRELVRDGAFELLVIGQDTTSYGDDIGIGLPSSPVPTGEVSAKPAEGVFSSGLPLLLKSISDAVGAESSVGWVRLMYAYPTNFTDEIIEAFAQLVERGRLLPYLDIPLQHASDKMLGAMCRNVTRSQQQHLCEQLRARVPGMAIRTTFITGFPGETDADHAELLDFIEEIGFDAVGCFRFSPEPSTPSARMDADPALHVPDEVKHQRHDEIMALQQRIAFEQAAYVADQFDPKKPGETGCRFDVLIDRVASSPVPPGEVPAQRAEGVFQGRTYFQAPQIDATTLVHARTKLTPGELVRCVIVGSEGYDLIAKPVDELENRIPLNLL